jgi:hypothetical protein
MATLAVAAVTSMGASAATIATVGTVATYAGYAMTGLSLLGGVKSGYAAEQAGLYEQAAFQAQAEGVKSQEFAEGLKSTEQSNVRRERLLQALAAQNLRAGAGSVTGSTVESMQLKSMEDYSRDQLQADVMSESTMDGFQRQRESLKIQGNSAKAQGKEAKKQSLLDMGMGLAEIGFSMGASAGTKLKTKPINGGFASAGGAISASGGSYTTGSGLAGTASSIHLSGRR